MRRSTRGKPASPPPAEEDKQLKGSILVSHFDKYIKGDDKQKTETILKRLLNDQNTTAQLGENNFFPIKMRFSKLNKDETNQLAQELGLGLPSTSTAAVPLRNNSPVVAAVSKRAKAKEPSPPKVPSPPKNQGQDIEMTREELEVYNVYEALMAAKTDQQVPIPPFEVKENIAITQDYEVLSKALLNKVIDFCKIVKYIVFEYLFMKDARNFDKVISDFAIKINTDFQLKPHVELLELLKQRKELKAIEESKFNELQTMIESAKVSISTKKQKQYMTAITASLAEIQKKYPVLFKNYKEVVVKLQKELGVTLTEPETVALTLEDELYRKAIVTLAINSNKMLLYKYCSDFLVWAQNPEHKMKSIEYSILKTFNIFTGDLDKQVFENFFVVRTTAKALSPMAISRQTKEKSILNILEKQKRGFSSRVSKKGIPRQYGGDEELAM